MIIINNESKLKYYNWVRIGPRDLLEIQNDF